MNSLPYLVWLQVQVLNICSSKEKIKNFFNYLDNLEEVSKEESKEIETSIKNLTEEEIKKIEKFFS